MFSCFRSFIQIRLLGSACVISLLAAIALAAPVPPEQAEQAARQWLRADTSPLDTALSPTISAVQAFYDKEKVVVFYVVNLSPEGFIIMGPDDRVEPIVAFSPLGSFHNKAGSPFYDLLWGDMPARVQALQARDEDLLSRGEASLALSTAQEKWGRLLADESLGKTSLNTISGVRVAPLVGSNWSQTKVADAACYNYYTPPNGAGSPDNYPSGCVATAIAQVLRFWQYPTQAVGTDAYQIYVDDTTSSLPLRGGNDLGGPYAWADMPLTPDASITEVQRQAIGRLLHDCGLAVNMFYRAAGSGSNTLDAGPACKNTFSYASAVRLSGMVDKATFNQAANPNLDAGCPVVLGITGSVGGHAIVCDGYGYDFGTLYHHLNFGWGGFANVWYNTPDTSVPDVSDFVIYKMVYNIFPVLTGEAISGRVTQPGGGTAISDVTITLEWNGGAESDTAVTNTAGIFSFIGLSPHTTYTLTATKSGFTFPLSPLEVYVSESEEYGPAVGNRWGLDFESSSGQPVIKVQPEAVTCILDTSPGATALQHLEVYNGDVGTLNYDLATTVSWITLSPASGQSSGPEDVQTHAIQVTPPGGLLGTLNFAVTVSDPSAFRTTVTIPLQVVILPSLSEVLDTPERSWTTSGDGIWRGNTEIFHYDGDAARAGKIEHDQTCDLLTTVIGPGTVRFWCKTSSEFGYDFLKVYIDDVEERAFSGKSDWQQVELPLEDGQHEIRFSYEKDFFVSSYEDTAWVDYFEVTRTTPVSSWSLYE